ncbi:MULTISPECIES: hypothetical protein [unclassified Desulfovibrio]|uniref:hypothetical protein n=1 Tax=unclassified Desulfovibrio TaxID=2593640 RepID=UPI0013EA38EE|nr:MULTISPECIES: hypothetical protein [unclassified Desulfovibrio]
MSGQRKAPTLTPAGVLSTREKLWRAMRELKSFRVPDLAQEAGIDLSTYCVRDYLLGLCKAGIVEVLERPKYPGAFALYGLRLDVGVDAPRVRRDGSLVAEPVQQSMWRAMKVLREFTAQDLVASAQLAGLDLRLKTAVHYCYWLARGGYLKAPKRRGEPYRLVKDTGPRAPQVLQLKQLYDTNTGEIATGQTLQEAIDAAEGAA